jgi:cytoskeletal protein CcmA (bactofilin family)
MPANKQEKVMAPCPHCGHLQEEPRAAFSTVCRKCHRNFRVQDALKPAPKAFEPLHDRKRITCFDCGRELEVPASAQSSMCKWCSRHIDLQDYRIVNAVSKNFKTKGAFTLEQTGYVFNTEAVVGDAVLKGRFLGKLAVERTLTIYSTAEIKGTFAAGQLIIPASNHFRWKELIKIGSAEIAGELAANIEGKGTITLKSTARMFGDMHAGNLIVEDGAVVVGNVRIGEKGS